MGKIEKRFRRQRLRWLGHVQRKGDEEIRMKAMREKNGWAKMEKQKKRRQELVEQPSNSQWSGICLRFWKEGPKSLQPQLAVGDGD